MEQSTVSASTPEAIQERADLFRLMADSSEDVIRLIDAEGRNVYVSEAATRLLGMRPEYVFERIHPDDLAAGQRWWQCMLAGASERFTWRVLDRHGAWRWLETWGRSVQYREQPYILTICRDVTQRVQVMEALRDNERRLEDAQRIAHIGSWDNDLGADQIKWSDETYRIFGLQPGDVSPTSATLIERIHPEDRHIQAAATAHALGGDDHYEAEYRIVRPNGEVRTIHSTGHVIRDSAGRPQRAFGVVQDVTDRIRGESALRESHGLLKAIVEGTSDVVFAKNIDGRYVMINAAGAHNLGRTVDEVIGKTDADLFSGEFLRTLKERDAQVLESGLPQTFEEEPTTSHVTRRYVTTKSVYRDEQGEVIGLVGISSEVTELKRLEEQFRQAQKMEAVGRLAGGVAHDFNNLLTVINSYSEMLMMDLPVNDPQRELLAEIRQAGDRAANLTGQLLAFSRRQILRPQVVNLNATLPDLLTLLRRLIGEDIELDLAPGAALGLTKIDRMQFDQAIINLAVNARDAMPDGGRLVIETRNIELNAHDVEHLPDVRPGPYVQVSVRDSGEGMDDVTMSRAFEPFFTTKESDKGTGLGLAMVYGFVKQSGGHIQLDSAVGVGTTFTIYLPRTEEADHSAPFVQQQPIATGSETVLLVEDEDAVRALSKRVLEASGYTVLDASNGPDAIRLAETHAGRIDVLVSDLVMPRMSGRQLAEALARSRPAMRVLFMSGYTDEAVLPPGVAESRVAFLQKPFKPIELALKVREALDMPG